MTRTRSSGHTSPPSESAPDNLNNGDDSSTGRSDEGVTPPSATDKGRRNPPRSSRGCKTIGRDYTDLVKPRNTPVTRPKSSESAARSGSAKVAPLAPPPPPPPALTLRTVVVDGVIKEAHCTPFVPQKTKLTLRRTKHGWGVTSLAATRTSASTSTVSRTVSAMRPPQEASDEIAMPDVDEAELTERLRQLYSRNKSPGTHSDKSSTEEPAGSKTSEANGEEGLAPTAASNVEAMQADRENISETGKESGKEMHMGTLTSESDNQHSMSELSGRLHSSSEGENNEKAIKREPKISVKSEFGMSMMCGDTPHLGLTFGTEKFGLDDSNSEERRTPKGARHSPMLASLLEGAQSAADSDRSTTGDVSANKSCELLKHLLSNSAAATAKDQMASNDSKLFSKLKFHNHGSQQFSDGKTEPSEYYKFSVPPAKTATHLDPKCKQTPSPASTPPIASSTRPKSMLWNFLNDPKVGIPEVLLIPVSRLKLLFSQPLVELANLSTFTTEALKYIGWHPAFRSVDIVKVSRDRLYRLLKDPRNEVKQLLTDPQARLFSCRRPTTWAGARPPGMVPLSSSGGQQGSAIPTSATTSLLRQKLMTRTASTSDLTAHCKPGHSPAVAGFMGGGGGGTGDGGVATAGAAVSFRTSVPVLSPRTREATQTEENRNQLLNLIKQPMGKQAFLTDEVTIRAIPAQVSQPQKRSLPDLIPQQNNKRRAPPELRPLPTVAAPQVEADLPPCPEDSDSDENPGLIAANFVQTCMEEHVEGGEPADNRNRSDSESERGRLTSSSEDASGVVRSVSGDAGRDSGTNGDNEMQDTDSALKRSLDEDGGKLSISASNVHGLDASEASSRNSLELELTNPQSVLQSRLREGFSANQGTLSALLNKGITQSKTSVTNDKVNGYSILRDALSSRPTAKSALPPVAAAASSDLQLRPTEEVPRTSVANQPAATGLETGAGGDLSSSGSELARTSNGSGVVPVTPAGCGETAPSLATVTGAPGPGSGKGGDTDGTADDAESGDDEDRLVINEDEDTAADTGGEDGRTSSASGAMSAAAERPANVAHDGSATHDYSAMTAGTQNAPSGHELLSSGEDLSCDGGDGGAGGAKLARWSAAAPSQPAPPPAAPAEPTSSSAEHTDAAATPAAAAPAAAAPAGGSQAVEAAQQAVEAAAAARSSESKTPGTGADQARADPSGAEQKADTPASSAVGDAAVRSGTATPEPASSVLTSALAAAPVPTAAPAEETAPSGPSPAPDPEPENGHRSPAAPSDAADASNASRKRSVESTGEEAAARKAARVDAEEQQRATPLALEPVSHRTVDMIESSLHKLRREVKAIDLLSRQKEREWDDLLRLRKAKEETFQRLRRKREVLLLQQADSTAVEARGTPAASAERVAVTGAANSPAAQLAQKQRAAAALLAQRGISLAAAGRSMRPFAGSATAAAAAQLGMGPQGPTISVRQLIENHRSGGGAAAAVGDAPPRRREPDSPHDPQYRDVLASIAKLSKQASAVAAAAAAGGPTPSAELTIQQVSAPVAVSLPGATGTSGGRVSEQTQPQSSLARLLMESKLKQVEPNVLNEILKRQPGSVVGSRLTAALLQSSQQPQQRPAPAAAAATAASACSGRQPAPPPPPPPPPPPARAAEEVPTCQGCRQRSAQFVCAGCGSQWYCSRECQVEAWDSHAEECSG